MKSRSFFIECGFFLMGWDDDMGDTVKKVRRRFKGKCGRGLEIGVYSGGTRFAFSEGREGGDIYARGENTEFLRVSGTSGSVREKIRKKASIPG